MTLASTDGATITGSIVVSRATLALPRRAVVRLRLEDASPEAAIDLIADEELPAAGRCTPIPFELRYDPGRIQPSHAYNLRAAVLVDDDLLFTSTTSLPVITHGAPSRVDIDLQPVSRARPLARAQIPLVDTLWRATDIAGTPVRAFDDAAPHITLHADDGRITGNGGCNRIVGFFSLMGESLRLELAATTMECGYACMAQERRFIDSLAGVKAYRLNGDRMDLLEGRVVLASFEAG